MTRRAERWAACALVLAAHALLIWLWPRASLPPRLVARPPEPMTLAVTLLRLPPAVPVTTATIERAAPSPAAVEPSRRRARHPPAAIENATQPITAVPAVESDVPTATAPSAAPALDLRLQLPPGHAERGGLTEPADSMRRQALNDPRSNVRPDPTRVLPDAVAASAKGDCLKGEYAGWGMGLLSAPFLAFAAATGNCKPQR